MSELKGAKVTVVSECFASQLSFYEHLYHLESNKLVSMERSWGAIENKDVLVIPCDNAWGIPTKISSIIVNTIGSKLDTEIKNHIFQMYFGEQPRGTSFLLPWRGVRGPPKSPRYICWTCMGRVDNDINPTDFCYSSIWSAFSAIHSFNKQLKMTVKDTPKEKEKKKKKEDKEKAAPKEQEKPLKTIVIPEFSDFLKDPDEAKIREISRQTAFALKTWLLGEFVEVDNLQSGLRRHEEITKPHQVSRKDLERELEGLIWSREILTRGLCNLEELDVLINWVNENGNYSTSAANAICDLLRRADTEFSLKQAAVSQRVTGKGGCLAPLIFLGTERKINVHTEISRKELEIGDKIGGGNAGTVYKGAWNGKPVAVKTFGNSLLDNKEFIKEVVMLSLVKSDYIVACYGASTENGDKFIVEELMQASLYDLLHNAAFDMNYALKLNFAHQISVCMGHLHSCSLIHRDLKSLNILVKDNVLKICDFGLTRVMDRNNTMTSNIGTVSWIAPEVFSRKNYTEKADVYSYGVILWELITREMPFGDVEPFSVPLLVTRGERPIIPKDCKKEMTRLIRACWNKVPNKRPDFFAVEKDLKRMINDEIAASKLLAKFHSDQPPKKIRINGSDDSVSDSHSAVASYQEQDDDSLSTSHTLSSNGNASGPIERKSSRKTSKGRIGSFIAVSRIVSIKAPAQRVVQVPPQLEASFSYAENEVPKLFSDLTQNTYKGMFHSGPAKTRHLLLNAKSLSINLWKRAGEIFRCSGDQLEFVFHNVTYSIGKRFGISDYKLVNNLLSSPAASLESITLLPVWLSFKGWSATSILEQSVFQKDKEEFFICWEQTYGFEAVSWMNHLTTNSESSSSGSHLNPATSHCVCSMITGYYVGWIQSALEFPIIGCECMCRARGDPACIFMISSPHKLKDNFNKFVESISGKFTEEQLKNVSIPKYVLEMLESNGSSSWVTQVIEEIIKEPPDTDSEPSFSKNEARKSRRKSLNIEIRKKLIRSVSQPKSNDIVTPLPPKPTSQKKIKISTSSSNLDVDQNLSTSNGAEQSVPPPPPPPRKTKRTSTASPAKGLLKNSALKNAQASRTVSDFFNQLNLKPEIGSIKVADDFHILVTADTFSTELYNVIYEYFSDHKVLGLFLEEKSVKATGEDIAINFLYDVGRVIGATDYNLFYRLAGKGDEPKKLRNAFLMNMCLAGWGNGEIFSSVGTLPSNTEEDFMIGASVYDTFEKPKSSKKKTRLGFCILSMGYISGWCEVNYGCPILAVEVACHKTVEEKSYCDFILSQPSKIEFHITNYFEEEGITTPKSLLPLLVKTRDIQNKDKPGQAHWLYKILTTTYANQNESKK